VSDTIDTDEEFHLDPDQVTDTFGDCLCGHPESEDHNEPGDDDVDIDCIVFTARFSKAKLEERRVLITQMLGELPDQFMKSKGGGWSFLNACDDRRGVQWTSFHRTMAMLFGLGQGLGLVTCLLPRDLWAALPGGMPYYVIDL
jgi:hypothetical protein